MPTDAQTFHTPQLATPAGNRKPSNAKFTTTFRRLARGDELFPGIVGYYSTVIPKSISPPRRPDQLFLGEKGQGKSRLMAVDRAFARTKSCRTSTFRRRRPRDPLADHRRRQTFVADSQRRHVPIGFGNAKTAMPNASPRNKFADPLVKSTPPSSWRHEHVAEEALHLASFRASTAAFFAITSCLSRPSWSRSALQHPRRARRANPRLTRSASTSTC